LSNPWLPQNGINDSEPCGSLHKSAMVRSQGQRVTNHLCNITEELFESDLEKEEKGKNQKTNRENRAKPNLKTVQQHY
jgi:hypothetical protein